MPAFSSPPDPRAYFAAVWQIVRQIPAGKVCTYGAISRLVPIPLGIDPKSYLAFAPRWVGSAMANCPEGIPWQRVINAQGKISPRPGSDGSLQRQLLEEEGVLFDERDRIDLKKFGWDGPQSAR